MSPAKYLAGLTIVEELRKELEKTHPEVVKEYEWLRNDLNALIIKWSHPKLKFVSLLNIWSICKRTSDVFFLWQIK